MTAKLVQRPAPCAGNYMSLNYKSSCRVICKIQQGERESAVIMVNEKCSLIDGTYFIVYFFFVFKFVFQCMLLALPCWNGLFFFNQYSLFSTYYMARPLLCHMILSLSFTPYSLFLMSKLLILLASNMFGIN